MSNILDLPEEICKVEGKDRAALKYAVQEALRSVHPDLKFHVKSITFNEHAFVFEMEAAPRRAPKSLRAVAQERGLKTMERIGEFSLVDYQPTNRKKPYILRGRNGDLYEAGEAFVDKVFSNKVKYLDAMTHIKKVFGNE